MATGAYTLGNGCHILWNFFFFLCQPYVNTFPAKPEISKVKGRDTITYSQPISVAMATLHLSQDYKINLEICLNYWYEFCLLV